MDFMSLYIEICKQIRRAFRYISWGLYREANIILDYVDCLQEKLDETVQYMQEQLDKTIQ